MLDEVNFLSSKNAQLEEMCAALPRVTEGLAASKKRAEVLLVLLGEKEEELEAAYADMKEVKHMYREQLDELINKIAPGTLPLKAPDLHES